MNIKQKIIRYSVGPLGAAIISLITIPLIAWFYSVDDVAKFSIFQSIIILYSLVLCLGLDQAFIREYYDSNDKASLLKNIFIGALLPSLLFLSITFVFFRETILLFLYDEYSIKLYLLTIFSCFFTLAIKMISAIQRVQEQALLFSLSQLLPKVIFLLLILIFLKMGSAKFENILWAQFLSVFFVFVYFLVINWRSFKESIRSNINTSNIKKYYAFGFPLILTGAVIWGLKLADRFYLKIFSDLKQLGLYAMAISIASGVAIFSGIFNTIWSPLVYKWVNDTDIYDDSISKKVGVISYKVSLCILAVIVFLVFSSKLIVKVLPFNYNDIYLIIPLCAISPLLYTLSEVTGIGINLMKKTKYTLWSCFLAIIVHIILSLLLIPELGAMGAAIAGAISFYVFFLIRTIFSNYIWINCDLRKTYIVSFLSLCISLTPVVFWVCNI
ncbi:lipopolysaccharide biosynthesis protein [Acinetobacter calcoaceticus]|uniref:lipopolysaccharide biosynthesis protein n=1 Tax=Acinetobacter calcoaceticus TaxID=471 RepID=UPI002B29A098|nr:oligosaccharide flippase family protein [Acinetobacter baumannii]